MYFSLIRQIVDEIVSYVRAHKSIIHLCLNPGFHCVVVFPLIWLSNNHLTLFYLLCYLCILHPSRVFHMFATYFITSFMQFLPILLFNIFHVKFRYAFFTQLLYISCNSCFCTFSFSNFLLT
jgi:hypothetical protein